MTNMEIYNIVRQVPKEAQKTIMAGRLKGMTDINPMWRIAKLTELFGACGIGWYTGEVKHWLEQAANNEVLSFCQLNLYIKQNNEWSAPIYGIGGSKMTAKESNGLYNSDECAKMAYTDAISVACKALGIGADVYYSSGKTKYTATNNHNKPSQQVDNKLDIESWWISIKALGYSENYIKDKYGDRVLFGPNDRKQALEIYNELKNELKKEKNIE